MCSSDLRAFPPARPSVLRTSPSSPGLCWTQEGDLEASDGGWGDAYTEWEPEAPRKGGRGQMPSPAPRPGAPIKEARLQRGGPQTSPQGSWGCRQLLSRVWVLLGGGFPVAEPIQPQDREQAAGGDLGRGGLPSCVHISSVRGWASHHPRWTPVNPRGRAAPSSQGTNVKLAFAERLLHAEPQRRGSASGWQLWG